jgi:uncharacterized RDD family membrane protein YckC
MRDAAGSWLEGSAFGRGDPRGTNLGLPADGPGSLASPASRLAAFLLDAIVANLLAGVPYLFGVHYGTGVRGYVVYAAFLLQEFVLVTVAGATIGKRLCNVRVVRAAGGPLPLPWVLVRTVLLGLLIPAVIWDRDGRGLHDRAAGALTLRAGPAGTRSVQQAPAATAQQSQVSETPSAPSPTKPSRPTTSAAPRKRTAPNRGPAKRRRKRR